MKIHLILSCLITAIFGSGCVYPSINKAHPERDPVMPSKRRDPVGYAAAISTNGQSWHGVRMVAVEKPDVTLAHKLDPVWWLKNSDDPQPPAWYRPHDKHRKAKWALRNPLHNFEFYVIGVADKTTVRKGWYPPQNTKPCGGPDFQITEYGHLRFPYFSYQNSWMRFNWGYRERGNYCLELHFGHQKDADKPKKERPAPVYAPYAPSSS